MLINRMLSKGKTLRVIMMSISLGYFICIDQTLMSRVSHDVHRLSELEIFNKISLKQLRKPLVSY